MLWKVYIDGQYGTTGLKIQDRLQDRDDVRLLFIPEDRKKDEHYRIQLMNEADIVFLCLPDQAAIQASSFISNPNTLVLDSSTAFRTDENWCYGLPELSPLQRKAIASSKRVAVPGCHATGFLLGIHPLVQSGMLSSSSIVTCHSLTGYSGGGRSLIQQHQSPETSSKLLTPQPYSLNLKHKHLPEMKKFAQLDYPPLFLPIVHPFYNGMLVTIPLPLHTLYQAPKRKDVHELLQEYYKDEPFIHVKEYTMNAEVDPFMLDPTTSNGTNNCDIFVLGNDEQALLACRLDNLGKGSSGAAIQCMNIMLGLDERLGLT